MRKHAKAKSKNQKIELWEACLIKTKRQIKNHLVVTALCVITAIAFTAIAYSIQVNDLQNQISSFQNPKLVNVNLTYSDNGKGVVFVSGYVYNVGNTTIYGSHVRVDLFRSGIVVNSTDIYFGNDVSNQMFGSEVAGSSAAYVEGNVTYTGASPTSVDFTLGWTQPWELPVP